MLTVVERLLDEPGLEWTGLMLGASLVDVALMFASRMRAPTIDACTFALAWRAAERLAAVGARRVFVCESASKMPGTYHRENIDAALGPRLRMAWTHAKFVVLSTPERSFSLLSSSNLAKNLRWEWHHMTDDPRVARALLAHLDDLDAIGAEPYRSTAYYLSGFKRVTGGRIEPPEQALAEMLWRL